MTHFVTLNIPDNLYCSLLKISNKTGKKTDELMIEYLQAMIKSTEDDPLEDFIDSINSNVSDWTENHDFYLGKSLSQ
ncbi:MAG: hypothetical protein N5P05_004606 (plasmid) [Chroococcopsis gigantea SAG 12.99]|jgi:hypothetical protein|nr:hypothetical protein [Chroococcopsis gigantea SAG 12.99]